MGYKRLDVSEVQGRLRRARTTHSRLPHLKWLARYYRHWQQNDDAAAIEMEIDAIKTTLPEFHAQERTKRRDKRVQRAAELLAAWQRKAALAKTKIRKLRAALKRAGKEIA